jgi:hydroxymethylglutaryl-CoA synthase
VSYIKAYDTSFPRFVVADTILHPNGRKNNHSVAYVDEDIITLAYAATQSCFADIKPEIDAILFATNTPVFNGRYHSSYLSGLLDLPQGITTLDTGTTNRAGTDALILADCLIRGGKHKNVLVVASHVSYPETGREIQSPFGHGAVAMVISHDHGLAEITATASYSASLAEEFIYKGEDVQYDQRFARSAGFVENMKQVLKDIDPKTTDSIIINSAYVKLIQRELQKAGFNEDHQVAADTLVPQCGYLGSAHGLLRLVHAIRNVKGNSVLVDYNNGSNVISLNVQKTHKSSFLPSDGSWNKTQVRSYQDYIVMRSAGDFKNIARRSPEIFSSEMMYEREKHHLIHMKGLECEGCNTVFYLKITRCNHCQGTSFTEKKLAKHGTVYSLTNEYYYPASFPPTRMVVIDLDGGGRVTVQQTDDMYPDETNGIKIDDRVELVLRKMMEHDRKPNYFWKCVKS